MSVKNIMEDCVIQKMDSILSSQGCCGCENCRDDILAISLNRLEPHYIATQRGELYSKVNSMVYQFDTDIVMAIVQAVEIVKAHPRHDGQN